MDGKNPYLHILLLSNALIVSGYLQFVVPGITQADSSSIFYYEAYPYWPNRTVDGSFSQNIQACLHTADRSVTEAWLRIDLGAVKSVKSVKFWYRNERGSVSRSTIRLRGYSIRVSNSSSVAAGSTDPCFIDDGLSILPTVIEEMCERTTRYVWFYQQHGRDSPDNSPILEICEVQIFGCETGTYDASCSRTCIHCKNSDTCDIDSGECDGNGCALPGPQSPMCSECIPGSYGTECNLNCSQFCHKTICKRTTGECVSGCEDGYVGSLCIIPCRDGTFGASCLYACSGNCLNNETCDRSDGGCNDCAPGWTGHFCNESCGSGKYGLNCQRECGHCFKVEHCFPTNGSCSGGCIEGYRGAMCSESIYRSTQDSDTPHMAVIAVLVCVIVILIIAISVGFVILRNARKKKETNSPVKDFDLYDLPNAKPENSVYDVISTE